MKHLLTIAGSDSSGGAGIQADLKTFAAHGVFGMSVITAVTAQNTCGVTLVQDMTPEMITAQIDAVFSDIRVDGVKIGMVSRSESIHAIAEGLKKWQPPVVVLDPVMISKSGYPLLQPEACAALIRELLPLATLLTPNLPEAEAICGFSIKTENKMEKAAANIIALGAKAVLVKGGHLEGSSADDFLFDGTQGLWLPGIRIQTGHTHGTGCTLSSALAANLAKGLSLEEAVRAGKRYVTTAIEHGIALGKGHGPTHHFVDLYKKAGMFES
ncbi:MAG: bifunctional hydroxymethylpyrimidine kinase/phosphomethylpyrimidine kinase [Acidaminococcaceae bacterium]|nr:bifunctional hydroxymethylpyrimidine kinase/phosphomethylpyrimidine kinase [Acidaminococcaceae bacterium]